MLQTLNSAKENINKFKQLKIKDFYTVKKMYNQTLSKNSNLEKRTWNKYVKYLILNYEEVLYECTIL